MHYIRTGKGITGLRGVYVAQNGFKSMQVDNKTYIKFETKREAAEDQKRVQQLKEQQH